MPTGVYPAYGNRKFKAPVDTLISLPVSGNATGDVRLVIDTMTLYGYDGASWNSLGGSGGSSDSFKTIQTITGTSPVATSATDTLTLESSNSSMDIVGDSSTDTIDFQVKSTYILGLLTGAISGVLTSDLTASRVLVSDGSGKISASAITTTVLGYLDATSSIQTQLNAKAPNARNINSGAGLTGGGDLSADRTLAVDINGQSEDTTPDLANDFVMTYDASAGGLKKVKLQNLSSGGGLADAHQFGTGADGALSLNSGFTTYIRRMNWTTGVITGTGSARLAATSYFSQYLDLTNAPADAISTSNKAGNGGAGATAGTAGSNPGPGGIDTERPGVATANGTAGAGGTAGGSQASASVVTGSFVNPSTSGAGGAGGSGSGGAGGASRGASTPTSIFSISTYPMNIPILAVVYQTSVGVPGGSGGGGDGTAGGGGGGPGGSGGAVRVFAKEIIRDSSTTAAGAISVNGGNGGNGGSATAGNRGGGGGGCGGIGGFVYLVYKTLTGSAKTGLINAGGGNGGNGGNGFGTGGGGNGGGSGGSGEVILVDLGAGTLTRYNNGSGAAGTAASGTTGGAGATGVACSVDL